MALSAFITTATGFGAGNLSLAGQKLHELLTLAGWTLSYANTNAIGTGSASNPKFDTVAFVASASAGIVAYTMPTPAPTVNAWVVQIELSWGITSALVTVRQTTAKAVSVAGVLTAPGTTVGGPLFTLGAECAISASEFGLLMSSNGLWVGLERRRSRANVVQDDVLSHQFIASGAIGLVVGGQNMARGWNTVEWTAQPLAVLTGFTSTSATSAVAPSSMVSGDGNEGTAVGPFVTSNGAGGILRHLQLWIPGDTVVASDQSIISDGSSRIYRSLTPTSLGGARLLIARS